MDATMRHFYQQFKPHYAAFRAAIQGINNQNECTRYAALLINRLLFLEFLQQNGWLAGDQGYLSHALEQAQEGQEDTFYLCTLLPLCQHLFLSASNKSSIDWQPQSPGGPLPQFKLSLFAPHPLEQTSSTPGIPDSAFADLFDFFARYRWSLTVPTSYDEETLNPAILAYVLERQSDQKGMGVYYTKDDVTAYITENTILPYILHTLQQHLPCLEMLQQLLRNRPDCYIHPHIRHNEHLPLETERDYQQRQHYYQQLSAQLQSDRLHTINDLITYRLDLPCLLQDFIMTLEQPTDLLICYNILESMIILDPTCGCGAFLLMALNILTPLYATCLERMSALAPQRWQENSTVLLQKENLFSHIHQYVNQHSFIVATILQHNLHGVDIMHEAIDTCKQRLLLTLLATLPNGTQTVPTINLDAHLHVGNALTGRLYDDEQEDQVGNAETFCWSQAFNDVLAHGGFDVIMGNPPYIEYSQLRKSSEEQQHLNIAGCGNLYAAVIEQALALCHPGQSYLGLIVPLSICSSERFIPLRQKLANQTEQLWLANFEIFPCRLFDNAYQRLTILLAHHHNTQPDAHNELFVTQLQRWYAAERPYLLSTMHYTQVRDTIRPTTFPRLAASCQETILRKLATRAEDCTLARLLSPVSTPHFVYYQEATNYWTKATCRIPFYSKNGLVMHPPHSRILFFTDEDTAHNIMALMNSSLFYLWFATYSDGFHLSHILVKSFPVGNDIDLQAKLRQLAYQLELDISAHAHLSTRNPRTQRQQDGASNRIELEEYYMVYSKPLLDQIDAQLAHYYALTDDELDFIINYDVKYRMGQHL